MLNVQSSDSDNVLTSSKTYSVTVSAPSAGDVWIVVAFSSKVVGVSTPYCEWDGSDISNLGAGNYFLTADGGVAGTANDGIIACFKVPESDYGVAKNLKVDSANGGANASAYAVIENVGTVVDSQTYTEQTSYSMPYVDTPASVAGDQWNIGAMIFPVENNGNVNPSPNSIVTERYDTANKSVQIGYSDTATPALTMDCVDASENFGYRSWLFTAAATGSMIFMY